MIATTKRCNGILLLVAAGVGRGGRRWELYYPVALWSGLAEAERQQIIRNQARALGAPEGSMEDAT